MEPPAKLDLNRADLEALTRQLGLSQAVAQRILAARPFASVEELLGVKGIGPKTYARLLPLLAVRAPLEPPPPAHPPTAAGSDSATSAAETGPTAVAGPGAPAPAGGMRLTRSRRGIAAALALILVVGAYFRLLGLNWDDTQHQHPDERFMTIVAEGIRPVGLFEYFDTQVSRFNPFRFGSYTYGMLPVFLTRYAAELVRMTEYDRVVLVGRALSAAFDLAAVAMLYAVGARYYNRRVGLLAAALSAAAVLPIQLSHYFAVDTFATVFIVAAFYVAAPVMDRGRWPHYALFGTLTGLATACKINTLPLAGVVVLAGLVRLGKAWRDPDARRVAAAEVLWGWALAGLLAFLVFRVFQPYAFEGPGFLGLKLSQRWLDTMREVTDQVAGRSEWPPNHHWTDRSQVTFAWTNMVVWGLGIPLGLAATAGWAWALWRCWRAEQGEWQRHLLFVVWVGGYFAWQNMQFWRYMRYFLPIYPLAILLAAWALVEAWDRSRAAGSRTTSRRAGTLRALSALSLAGVLAGTYAYAFAFTRIYDRPHTRVVASRWMLENIPGPVNVLVGTGEGRRQHPLSAPDGLTLVAGEPWTTLFQPRVSGTVEEITVAHLFVRPSELSFTLTTDASGEEVVAEARMAVPAGAGGTPQTLDALFPHPISLTGERVYHLQYTVRTAAGLAAGGLALALGDEPLVSIDGEIAAEPAGDMRDTLTFTPPTDATVDRISIGSFHSEGYTEPSQVRVTLARDDAGLEPMMVASTAVGAANPGDDWRVVAASPVQVEAGQIYHLKLEVTSGVPVTLSGSRLALETSWDDALPLRVDGYDPLGGIYQPLDLQLFEPDTEAKRANMLATLDRADYIVVASNRAYDAMPRLPLRYPLTLKYYQALFDCPAQLIVSCAYPARPPLRGPLGFDLVQVFESNPALAGLSFSDQAAEEAFTVYDHPKVMIFKKSPEFSLPMVRRMLESVDLSQVLEQSPVQYTAMPNGLRLSPDRLAAQREGGTWSDMFDRFALINWYEPIGAAAWYLTLLAVGWLAFPLVFIALPGLPDRGYPLAKLVGLMAVTWLAWFGASYKVLAFRAGTLWLGVALLAAVGAFIAYRRWPDLSTFVRARWRYLLLVEGLVLALFLFDLAVRWGNPDLWHPWLGGEKPADYSFFQAAIKSVYFPPYDPWLAGHYVNYYYYGFVMSAVPTKLLGVLPSIAYNLALPTWFSFAGIGAFCVAYNLVAGRPSSPSSSRSAALAGVGALVLMTLLGNLFQVRLLWQYLPEAAAYRLDPESSSVIDRAGTVLSGAWQVVSGNADLPGDKGRWYFAASRAINHNGVDTPITEFPLFSYLYADLHPHLMDMPILLAALAWMLSFLLAANGQPGEASAGRLRPTLASMATWFIAGLVFGATQPTHTWDFPVFLGLGALAVAAGVWIRLGVLSRRTLAVMAAHVLVLAVVAVVMYYPFRQWFATEFTSIEFWGGARTPLKDYLTVHGLFLYILVTFLAWETVPWLKSQGRRWLHTPLGELWDGLRGKMAWLGIGAAATVAAAIYGWYGDYQSLLLIVPLSIWTGALLLRPGQPVAKQILLALTGAGLGLTLVVELVVLKGDVGRSNTVFKFYIQVWTFFSVAAGAALAWLVPAIFSAWGRRLRWAWLGSLAVLVLAAGTYSLTAVRAKVEDRWPGIPNPPRTLNGMAYMLGSNPFGAGGASRAAGYDDEGRLLNLAYDYAAMTWLQDYVPGTPVIVEGTTPLYRWGNRFAIYTGLPAVVGWDWHLKLHNSVLPGSVVDSRVEAVRDFYNTSSVEQAAAFLERYQVEYIVVGELERAYYDAAGLAKFPEMVEEGRLRLAFPSGREPPAEGTAIYQVITSDDS